MLGQAGVLLIFLLALGGARPVQIVNPFLTSYPCAIGPTFLSLPKVTPQQASIVTHTIATLYSTLIGLALAMIFGTAIAGVLWWWEDLQRIIGPYPVVANAMPKTAFVPIFYIWLGPSQSIYAMSLAISLFVTILMIYLGFQSIDPNKIKLARILGATKIQIFAKVIVPGSVPLMIAALKVSAGLSLVGVIVGEFQSANVGLGYLIQYGSQIFRLDMVMTSAAVLGVMSSLIYVAIVWVEACVMRSR